MGHRKIGVRGAFKPGFRVFRHPSTKWVGGIERVRANDAQQGETQMTMNRRNVLIGLGAVAAGGGAALGTGAFSQVQADRTVNVGVSNDAGALLQISEGAGASGVVGLESDSGDGNASIITFDEQNLNADAITTYENALEVANDGEETGATLKVSSSESTIDTSVMTFEIGGTDITDNAKTISDDPSSPTSVDISIDLTGTNSTSDIDGDVQFVADTT